MKASFGKVRIANIQVASLVLMNIIIAVLLDEFLTSMAQSRTKARYEVYLHY
jgi:hypothetical protein